MCVTEKSLIIAAVIDLSILAALVVCSAVKAIVRSRRAKPVATDGSVEIPATLQILLTLLASDNVHDRHAAVELLAKMGKTARPAEEALGERSVDMQENPRLRQRAADVLQQLDQRA